MMSRCARFVAVSLLTCAFVLTGCSADPTDSGGAPVSGGSTGGAATTTAVPSTSAGGDEVAARSGGFTVVPPEGWGEATEHAAGIANIDLVLVSSRKVDGFANNLVVITVDGDEATLREELDKGREQMAAAGRTVAEAADKTVAGATAIGFTTTFQQQGIAVLTRSYAVHRSGKIYLLTLSSSQRDADHAMSEFDELTSSWVWA